MASLASMLLAFPFSWRAARRRAAVGTAAGPAAQPASGAPSRSVPQSAPRPTLAAFLAQRLASAERVHRRHADTVAAAEAQLCRRVLAEAPNGDEADTFQALHRACSAEQPTDAFR